MLVNLFGYEELSKEFKLTFSYRSSLEYQVGFGQRVQQNLTCYPIFFPNFDKNFTNSRAISFFLRGLCYLPLLIFEVVHLGLVLRKVRPDIVHINNGGYPGALSCRAMVLAASFLKVPKIIMVVNNLAVPYCRPSRWLDWLFDRGIAVKTDLFITGSLVAGRRLSSVLKLPANKLLSIYNGVYKRDIKLSAQVVRQRYGLSHFEGLVIGVVALHEPRKGHKVLLDAVAKILKTDKGGSNFRLLIEGDGPLKSQLQDLVLQRNHAEQIHFVGNEPNIFDFMNSLDLLILPSVRDEDFPNVILEAMSLAKPVIASRLAGIPEQIEDGVSGLLVDPGNVDQLAEAIKYFIKNQKACSVMGIEGFRRFSRYFSGDIASKRYLKLYCELLNDRSDKGYHA